MLDLLLYGIDNLQSLNKSPSHLGDMTRAPAFHVTSTSLTLGTRAICISIPSEVEGVG